VTAQFSLCCQRLIIVYAPKTMTQAPVARPSRPSVRLTPLDAPVMSRLDHRRKSRAPSTGPAKARSSLVSRTNETAVDTGALPFPSVVHRASATKTTVTSVCPASFCRDVRPRLRSARILVKSSRKPTTPSPTRRKRTSRALTETGSPVTPPRPPASTAIRMRCDARYPISDAAMITAPPMVGLPRLTWCRVRSSWIGCP
jgi:hypothetical protein